VVTVDIDGGWCTQVASRRVVVISAIIMVIGSVLGKWSAVLIMIPEPVIGGLLVIICGELQLLLLHCCSVHYTVSILDAISSAEIFAKLKYINLIRTTNI